MLELVFACAHLGAILVPINNRLTAPEVCFQLGDCEPSVVLADAARSELILAAGARPEALDGFASLAHASPQWGGDPDPAAKGGPEHSLLLVYTSGTTGTPKGRCCRSGRCATRF